MRACQDELRTIRKRTLPDPRPIDYPMAGESFAVVIKGLTLSRLGFVAEATFPQAK